MNNKTSALLLAARKKHLETCQRLLKLGADAAHADKTGLSLVHYAARSRWSVHYTSVPLIYHIPILPGCITLLFPNCFMRAFILLTWRFL